MTSWSTFEEEAPELAKAVRGRLEAHLHHVLATLRAGGGPRVSGTEVRIVDGELWLGSMPRSVKGRDLRRDPRCALHSAPLETDLAEGDAKLTGRAVEITDRGQIEAYLAAIGSPATDSGAELFRIELDEVALVRVRGDLLHIARWRPGQPVTHVERR